MGIKQKIIGIKDIVLDLVRSHFWLQAIVALFASAITGSTFIGFINRYAVYNYAVSFGGRLPVEGVPYLDLAVSLLSFAFFLISFTCAIGLYLLLRLITRVLRKLFKLPLSDSAVEESEEIRSRKGKLFITIVGALAGLLTSIIGTVPTVLLPVKNLNVKSDLDIIVYLVVILSVILTILSIWPKLVRWFAVLLTIGLIVFVSIRLFIPISYAKFLREIHYGGGLSTSIVSETTSGKEKTDSGFLFITSTDHYILYKPEDKIFVEIPTNLVKELRYDAKSVFKLPTQQGTLLNLFIHFWRSN